MEMPLAGTGLSRPKGEYVPKLLASMLVLLMATGALPSGLFDVHGTVGLSISVRSQAGEEVYTLEPGEAYEIRVSRGNATELYLTLTGPSIPSLTGSFAMVWNQSGFFDLGTGPENRCLVQENCSAMSDELIFSVVLPPQAASGIWEARVECGEASGATGFQVSTVFWNATVLSGALFVNATPGGTSAGSARIVVSCNGLIGVTLACDGLVGPGGVSISSDRLYLDDDPVCSEAIETGDLPRSFGDGQLGGPGVDVGANVEVELFLFLEVPRPMMLGAIVGNITYEFHVVEDPVPALAEAYIEVLRFLVEDYRPPQPVQIEYAADLDTASHRSGLVYPLDFKLKQLGVLEEVGVDTIRMTLAHDPFLQNDQAKINDTDQLVSQIKAKGKKLMIADGAAEQYWNDPMSWSAFSQAFIDRVTEIATRYRPDYYIVVKEPIWYMGLNWTTPLGMISQVVTVEQWISLTQQLCDAVKAASPQTQVGVSIALPYIQSQIYLAFADQLPDLDFVGIDVYTLIDLDVLDASVGAITKPKWILETWDGHPDRQEGQHWRRTSSAEWIRMMDSYAQSRGFAGMASFYNLFLCYDYGPKPGTFIDVWFALDDRQESFFALQDIAG